MSEAFQEWVPVLTVGAIIFCALILLLKGLDMTGVLRPQYRAVPLLTKAEQSVWRAIVRDIPSPFVLSPKVRLADIINPMKDSESRSG